MGRVCFSLYTCYCMQFRSMRCFNFVIKTAWMRQTLLIWLISFQFLQLPRKIWHETSINTVNYALTKNVCFNHGNHTRIVVSKSIAFMVLIQYKNYLSTIELFYYFKRKTTKNFKNIVFWSFANIWVVIQKYKLSLKKTIHVSLIIYLRYR